MSNEETPAARAANAYFKGTEERSTKGSAMSMISDAKGVEISKTARLKAAREERDEAQAVVDAEAKAKVPAKKPRTKKPALGVV